MRTLIIARLISVVLAFILAPKIALAEPGDFFAPLSTGTWSSFDRIPAYRSRVYVGTALAALAQRCPAIAPKGLDSTSDAVIYFGQTANESQGLGGGYYRLAVAAEDSAFIGRANGANDIGWLIERSGCSASAHQGWVVHARQMLREPGLAGALPVASQVCEKYRETPTRDCSCFARSFDMEATPSKRRLLLGAATPLEGMQQALRDGDFAARVGYKCQGGMPNFFRTELTVTMPSNAKHPDDGQRLREGAYQVRGKRGFQTYSGTCTISRLGNWRYEFKWVIGGRSNTGIGILSGSRITVQYGAPHAAAYSVAADGTLRAAFPNDGEEQLIPAAEALGPAGPASRTGKPTGPRVDLAVEARRVEARAAQCARILQQLAVARTNPRRANVVEVLDKRYARWCEPGQPGR